MTRLLAALAATALLAGCSGGNPTLTAWGDMAGFAGESSASRVA